MIADAFSTHCRGPRLCVARRERGRGWRVRESYAAVLLRRLTGSRLPDPMQQAASEQLVRPPERPSIFVYRGLCAFPPPHYGVLGASELPIDARHR
jgi:hypothetical protein